MDKKQTVWLIVRLIGVYFGYWAIVSLLSLIGAIYAYTSLPSAPNSSANKPQQTIQVNGISIPTNPTRVNQSATTTSGAENPADKAKSDALKEVLWQFFLTVIYGGIGFYLIRNGKILFSTLKREELTDEADETESFSPAKPKEKTVTTLDLSPSVKKEEVTSLNLSEYVPKKEETKQPEILHEPPKPEVPVADIEPKPADLQPEISPAVNEQTWKNLEIAPPETAAEQSAPIEPSAAPVEQIEMPKVSDDELLTIEPQTNEQPNEQSAPSDVSADAPSDEKK